MLPAFAWAGNLLAQARRPRRRAQPSAPAPAATHLLSRPNLAQLAGPDAVLPAFVAHDAVARKHLALLDTAGALRRRLCDQA